MPNAINNGFWCGTDASLAHYMLVMQQRAARDPSSLPVVATLYDSNDTAPKEVPRLFSQAGDVGVIQVAGPLTNTDSPWNKYDGVVSYNEIRDALIHAATDPSIGAIVLDINSGGGAVSGVSDTAELISKIDTQMKPVHTFSDGQIASAAYWLGVSARTVDIGKVAEAGSIGVIAIHRENSKMMADLGIGVTVMRAGKFKGLGNSAEPLGEAAKAEIQGQLDTMYLMFMSHVAAARGMDYPSADSRMGQGKVFVGQQAVDAGLADSVSSFDSVVSKAQVGIDKAKSLPQYSPNFPKGQNMRLAMTDQQIAALAEGGTTAALTPVAAAAAQVVAEAATPAPAPDVPEAPAPEAAAAPAPAASPDLLAFLKTSLSEAQAANTDLTVQLRDLKASSEAMTTSHAALRAIAEASVDRLKVALGGSAGGAQALSDVALLADHASLRAQFEGKFKAGGVAAVSSSGSTETVSEAPDPVRQARIASTRATR